MIALVKDTGSQLILLLLHEKKHEPCRTESSTRQRLSKVDTVLFVQHILSVLAVAIFAVAVAEIALMYPSSASLMKFCSKQDKTKRELYVFSTSGNSSRDLWQDTLVPSSQTIVILMYWNVVAFVSMSTLAILRFMTFP
ncbi:hypothetical protein CCR75_009495 [Bremia lactucae]|uniref:Uncharacterized protein n=1 Tax=Bremia lactucae TaxID=4779 RepID=A0A976IEP7_BRELC|nr:hypothetical protein CCR75_009495 [Bremia lactucae]